MSGGMTSPTHPDARTLDAVYDQVYANKQDAISRLDTTRWPRSRWEALVRVCPARPARLLEIGCGNGTVLYHLATRCEKMTGVEISPVRCRVAERNLAGVGTPVEILHGNIEHGLDKPDGYFDVILWSDVIEHVVDVFAAMHEVSRLLCRGGTLITSTPNVAYLPCRLKLLLGQFPATASRCQGFAVRPGEMYDGGHLHYFTGGTLKTLYRKHGIEPVSSLGFGRRFGRLRNLWPTLLSGALLVVGRKL